MRSKSKPDHVGTLFLDRHNPGFLISVELHWWSHSPIFPTFRTIWIPKLLLILKELVTVMLRLGLLIS